MGKAAKRPRGKGRRTKADELAAYLEWVEPQIAAIKKALEDPDSLSWLCSNFTGIWYNARNLASTLRLRREFGLLGEEIRESGDGAVTAEWVLRRLEESASDKKSDKQKKLRRMMDAHAANCARRYRNAKAAGDMTATMQGIVEDYAAEMAEKATEMEEEDAVSIKNTLRILSDNPDQWKN